MGDGWILGNGIYTEDLDALTGYVDSSITALQAYVDGAITDSIATAVLQAKQGAYPIGSIYYNAENNTNPATLLGFGTWTATLIGRVPVGKAASGTFGTLGGTMGAETHTLSTTEMPSHIHPNRWRVFMPSGTGSLAINDRGGDAVLVSDNASHGGNGEDLSGNPTVANSSGGGGAHNNIQPSEVVSAWRRTA